jgi:FAD/FMN-containing dehydrogenase/Fe-S oxidoreductase
MSEEIQSLHKKLEKFKSYFSGTIFLDEKTRLLYATDAGLYRKLPLAVAYPQTSQDLKNLIIFCRNNSTHLIPRTAGTSLGGQCVGEGIVVDVSHFMNQILEINEDEKWVKVQPGVVRDELNLELKKRGLYFGPNTSTSNRAMIGGMVGNNSSGSYSIKYGTTRENVLEVKGFLSDGSEVVFGDLDMEDFRAKAHGTTLESAIYRQISFELSHPLTQESIEKEFPKKSVTRRNTGYAIDQLLDSEVYYKSEKPFNFSKMLCGSEGTLMLFSEIKLKLHPLPTEDIALICAHFDSLEKSLLAAVEVMKLAPNQCELMDKIILDCTKDNLLQAQNRFFIKGDPQAILMIEVEAKENKTIEQAIEEMVAQLKAKDLIYDTSILFGNDIKKALHLRASGLGVLQNIKSDDKPLEFVEDTAVDVVDLPAYIADFEEIMANNQTSSVYYAHAGAGELHIRPKVNLKTKEGRERFRKIATESAHLVKKHQGSLSGEHGDGRVRSEFIPIVLGQRNYDLLKRIKSTWDPYNIFNPGKIVDPFPMDADLRDDTEHEIQIPDTFLNFEKEGNFLKALEKCSGSGDCRKSSLIGGTLCPSYQATKNEKDTTRARANILRELVMHSEKIFEMDSHDAMEVLSLCLSCKACLSECPSSVDMASIKAEYLYQYQKKYPADFGKKFMAHFYKNTKKMQPILPFANVFLQSPLFNWLPKKIMKIDSGRSFPKYSAKPFENEIKTLTKNNTNGNRKIFFYCDEFTNFLDASIAKKAVQFLQKYNIEIVFLPIMDSARSYISKGFLEEAKQAVIENISILKSMWDGESEIVGLEPSAVLGFKEDYFRLIPAEDKAFLEKVASKIMLVEEYVCQLIDTGIIQESDFEVQQKEIKFHGHCHQKSLSSTQFAKKMLSLPKNYTVSEIPSGCCGMAGSFGYEQYETSMKIGEMVLFPAVRNASKETVIAASGTSCRHQIKDGTKRESQHPIEILYKALKK